MRIAQRLLLAGFVASALACSNGNGTTADAGPDGSVADMGTPPDGTATDSGGDGGLGRYLMGTCATPINLNTSGMSLPNHVTSVHGSNNMAPMAAMTGLAAPTCAPNNIGYQVVFSYTMATTAALEVNTDIAGTDSTVDTIAYVLSTCGATGTELACNDDNGAGVHSTAFTSGTIMAGTTVFIVVGGYSPQPMGATNTPNGNIALQVSEIVPQPLGGTCSGTNPVCVTGAHCTQAALGDATGTCTNDGTAMNSTCRTTAPFCDGTMLCSAPMPTAGNTGICQAPVAHGAQCTAMHFVCVTGDHCIADPTDGGQATTGTCKTDGTAGALCIPGAAGAAGTCNTGLTCNATTNVCG